MKPPRPGIGFVSLSLALVALCAPVRADSAAAHAPDREVLVMFQPGVVTMPDKSATADVSASTLQSVPALDVISAYGVKELARAFPEFDKSQLIAKNRSGQTVQLADMSEVYVLVVPDGQNPDDLARKLSQVKGVVYAERNGGFQLCAPVIPNDPSFPALWGMNNTGQTGGTADADIDAPEAWELSTGTTNEIIGVIDYGVDNSNPDLNGKVSGDAGWSGIGHGFHVAGIAAANANNSIGVAGVDWAARIVSQRIDTSNGDQDIYNAIMDAVNAGCDVLNNSWILTNPDGSPRYSTTVAQAFANAYKLNRLSCAAMGNEGVARINYPAGFGQGIVAVGATDHNDTPASFTTSGAHIDVAAPGVNIYSTLPGNSYGYLDGTSMATPHVAGTAALVLSVSPTLYNDDVEQIIRLSADDDTRAPATVGFDNYTGTGRINARRALDFVKPPYYMTVGTAGGGTDVGTTNVTMTFYSVPGLATGVYFTKRHEVRKAITFPTYYTAPPKAWGRGLATAGYSLSNPNFGLGWSDVVPGTLTPTGCTMRTYVYQVFDAQGRSLGWFPTTVGGAVVGYAVHGTLAPVNVGFSGPALLNPAQSGTWTANATGGTNSFTYEWSYRPGSSGAWTVVGTSQSYVRTMGNEDFQLMVKASSAGMSATSTILCVACSANPLAPVVQISGPTQVASGAQGSWTATGTGGRTCGVYTYAWQYRTPAGSGPWSAVVGTNANYSMTMPPQSLELLCTLAAQAVGSATYTVQLADVTPPAQITNLAGGAHRNGVVLSWTAPGDDGNVGQAAEYDLRYSVGPMVDFWSSTPIPIPPPQAAGAFESACTDWLTQCTWYGFAIRTKDESGNWSAISPFLSKQTTCSGASILCDLSPGLRSADAVQLPLTVEFGRVAPNPSHGPASINYGIPSANDGEPFDISVFDVAGRRVQTLEHGMATPGRRQSTWDLRSRDGSRVGGGVYFLRLSVGSTQRTQVLVVTD